MFLQRWVRSLYDWVLRWAEHPKAPWALFLLAFSESSIFPIPPDVLLIVMAVAAPARSLYFATLCSAGSVLGGILGYVIGSEFYEVVGRPIVNFYGAQASYLYLQDLYRRHDALAVAIAGFSPVPYKIATIAGGVFKIHFWRFVAVSAVSRSARFFIVALMIRAVGERARDFIDRYFNALTAAFAILLIAGFAAVRWLAQS